MVSLPIDVVNYICELAAGHDKLWYPFFSPKTEKVSWKVNQYCTKFIMSSKKFLNPIIEENINFYNQNSGESIETKCRMILFEQHDYCNKKIYIEFDSSDGRDYYNNGKFMLRALLNTINGNIKSHNSIYINGTEYATILYGWLPNKLNRDTIRMTICYETY